MKPSAPDSLLDKKKKADQALAWPAPMGSEGEGGTPKPTARRTFPASPAGHRPEPVARARCSRRRSGAPVAEVGFATTAAQGHADGESPKIPPYRLITGS